jgi:hypothetical protein
MENNIFSYGINVNIGGNYTKETNSLNRFFNRFNSNLNNLSKGTYARLNSLASVGKTFSGFTNNLSNTIGFLNQKTSILLRHLFSLRSLLLGGMLGYGINRIASSFMNLGKQMEQSYARMYTALGTQKKVRETLKWARIKAVETPFELPEINEMITTLTMFGKTKKKEDLENYFQAIGEFAGAKAMGLQEASMMLIRASFGNWRWMKMRFGIAQESLTEIAKESPRHREELIKLAKTINTVKAGTDAYADSVIRFFSLYSEGGMQRLVKTFSGAMSNIHDLWSNTMIEIVGYSQEKGSFFSFLANTANKFLEKFDKVVGKRKVIEKPGILTLLTEEQKKMFELNGYYYENIRLKDRLFSAGKKLGNVLTGIWSIVDNLLMKATDRLGNFILKADKWLGNYKGNIAPLLVFLSLLKDRIISFFKAFKEGFLAGFKPFWTILKTTVGFIGKLFFGNENSLERTAKALGSILGFLIGIKSTGFLFKFAAGFSNMFAVAASKAGLLFTSLSKIKLLGGLGGVLGTGGRFLEMATAMPVRVVNFHEFALYGGLGGGGVKGLVGTGVTNVAGKGLLTRLLASLGIVAGGTALGLWFRNTDIGRDIFYTVFGENNWFAKMQSDYLSYRKQKEDKWWSDFNNELVDRAKNPEKYIKYTNTELARRFREGGISSILREFGSSPEKFTPVQTRELNKYKEALRDYKYIYHKGTKVKEPNVPEFLYTTPVKKVQEESEKVPMYDFASGKYVIDSININLPNVTDPFTASKAIADSLAYELENLGK